MYLGDVDLLGSKSLPEVTSGSRLLSLRQRVEGFRKKLLLVRLSLSFSSGDAALSGGKSLEDKVWFSPFGIRLKGRLENCSKPV